eukprot:SAG11_NODE_20892_length_436_cov_0.913947_1_plen_94_part_10
MHAQDLDLSLSGGQLWGPFIDSIALPNGGAVLELRDGGATLSSLSYNAGPSVRHTGLRLCLFACLFVCCLPVCLSFFVCLFVGLLSVCLFVCLS